MSALDDERSYALWTARKTVKLDRKTLDCGHPNLGEVSIHLWCDFLACPGCADVEHDCSAYAGAKSSSEKAPERLEAVSPVPAVQCDTSPWVSFASVAAGPSVVGSPAMVDIRRSVQDGIAPAPDRAGEVFRAEVLRQGLAECEIDGVRWIYGGGRWSKSPYQPEPVIPLVDEVLVFDLAPDPVEPDPDVHSRPFKFTDLFAALKKRRTRRPGGTT